MSYADSESPIIQLSAKKHFKDLDTKAQLYAHHLSKASFWGTRVVSRSISPESERLYDLILSIHKKINAKSNEDYIKSIPIDKQNVIYYLEYSSQVLSNLGNYKSFGDKKFIPQLPQSEFDELIKAVNDESISEIYESIRDSIYDTSVQLLGWPEHGQLSSYYVGKLITKKEVDAVNSAMAEAGIMPENTRVEKIDDSNFVVHVASADTENNTGYYPGVIKSFEGFNITFKFGDHQREFQQIVHHLTEASKYVANETQGKLIKFYTESFKTGSMNAHKDSQIEWVKDLQPAVESNIGFIETYRDPSGVRGEWEGLVAMVNNDRTKKFSSLVENATPLISKLPWDHFYEKDTFNPPDFTSLEVLTFAGSGIPAGINIPNYDDVRLNYGFKNVSLGNVLSANPKNPKKEEIISFLGEDLLPAYKKWRDDAFEIQVGLHELLGHGSGKLLQETEGGFNFDRSSELGKSTSFYKSTESWGSLFGLTSGSYEECRAELVAIYLMLKEPESVLPIFGIEKKDFQEVMLAGTVYMARAGLLALEYWDPETKIWGQPHMRARFAITKCLIEAGVVSFVHEKADYSDLVLKIEDSKLETAAVDALGDFLNKLHVYKSTANVSEGTAFYNSMTTVDEMSKFRDVVLKQKLPRKQIIQANTFVGDEIEVREYDESECGMIQSYVDRET
ncbi:probable dipeptidyl peptidase 3 [[Candida] jaroonii]|uniref:Probable dipeptidyl peptidase 3 n=1 Tax=[Candida] jaroonii TaxID=467808 RepID=A0ACA9Y7S1_9ASCO|nr:probable dipeptidyl peptidase 3 [[Candida] jaroonii]